MVSGYRPCPAQEWGAQVGRNAASISAFFGKTANRGWRILPSYWTTHTGILAERCARSKEIVAIGGESSGSPGMECVGTDRGWDYEFFRSLMIENRVGRASELSIWTEFSATELIGNLFQDFKIILCNILKLFY